MKIELYLAVNYATSQTDTMLMPDSTDSSGCKLAACPYLFTFPPFFTQLSIIALIQYKNNNGAIIIQDNKITDVPKAWNNTEIHIATVTWDLVNDTDKKKNGYTKYNNHDNLVIQS